jgi:folate-binding protein YgfZ
MGEYAGCETALAFGPHHDTVQHSFDVLRSGCAVYDLGWRAKLALTGSDRVRWLNGMVTNNIRDLAPDHGVYNFVLSPQGRIQADCYAYQRGEYLLVGTEMDQAARLKEIFDKYIIMDDVEVTDISDKLTAIGVQGPEARSVLERAGVSGLDVAPMELRDITWNNIGLTITRMASEDFVTYELWFAPANAAVIWDALVSAGATPVGTDALELFRIAAGVPKYGQDIRDRDLPQETNQSHALHFAKGCYVGQEIVERIRSRGQVHRLFTGFEIDGVVEMVSHTRGTGSVIDLNLTGTKLTRDGKEVGEITSAALIDDRVLALGYVRREFSAPGTELQAGTSSARVQEVPFIEAKHTKSHVVMN